MYRVQNHLSIWNSFQRSRSKKMHKKSDIFKNWNQKPWKSLKIHGYHRKSMGFTSTARGKLRRRGLNQNFLFLWVVSCRISVTNALVLSACSRTNADTRTRRQGEGANPNAILSRWRSGRGRRGLQQRVGIWSAYEILRIGFRSLHYDVCIDIVWSVAPQK